MFSVPISNPENTVTLYIGFPIKYPEKGKAMNRLNPYWGKESITDKLDFSGESYCLRCEADLLQSLNDEAALLYGVSAIYLLKTLNTYDPVFGETAGAVFKHHTTVSIIPMEQTIDLGKANVSPMGFAFDAMTRFQIGVETLNEAISALNVDFRNSPQPGDLLYVPVWKAMFQINYINKRIKNLMGRFPTYELTVQIYDMNDATFQTYIPEIDALNERIKYEEAHRPNEIINQEKENIQATETYIDEWKPVIDHSKLNDIFVRENDD